DRRIFGDGINIAARLEGLCEPGGICISGKVYDEIKDRFQIGYKDLGRQKLKNIQQPVQTYQISVSAGSTPATTRRGRIQPLSFRGQLIAACTGFLVLSAAALGWWSFPRGQHAQAPAVASQQMPTMASADQPGIPDSRSNKVESQGFDGMWEFSATG